MKKNYVLFLLAVAATFCTANAQFVDDFESYPLGTYHGGNWSSWGGSAGAEDIIVSNAFAFNGTKSGLIGGSTVQDAMLRLGNKTSGVFQLSFQAYIPAGKSGYMNFQGTTTANGGAGAGGTGIFNSPNLIFNNVQSATGAPGLGGAYPNVNDAAATYTWQYPEATWFPVVITFDVDTVLWTMTINGVALPAQAFDAEAVIGAIDFFSFDANNELYIDAISYADLLSVGEESRIAFKAYPNPVVDYLYLSTQSKVDLVEVYDVLGQNVLTTTPAIVSPRIDLSSFSSGAYFVKVSTGNQSKTIKIIK
jgi:phenolic acid decarboxylase